jgi:hypothetical protein
VVFLLAECKVGSTTSHKPSNNERSRSGDLAKGVEPIGLADLGRLGINADDQLFWDGRRIEARQSLVLIGFQIGFQTFIATPAALCVVQVALGGFVTAVNNASIFLCARGNAWLICPPPTSGLPQVPLLGLKPP